jgi:hypothetical protein
MKWRAGAASPPEPADEDTTVSEETLRAIHAAESAEADLVQTRLDAPGIAEPGEKLRQENRHNGFYLLIRQALGSN